MRTTPAKFRGVLKATAMLLRDGEAFGFFDPDVLPSGALDAALRRAKRLRVVEREMAARGCTRCRATWDDDVITCEFEAASLDRVDQVVAGLTTRASDGYLGRNCVVYVTGSRGVRASEDTPYEHIHELVFDDIQVVSLASSAPLRFWRKSR